MTLSLFTKQKNNDSLTLLVDIGSSSIGVALVKIKKDRAPHILASIRENISFQEVLSSRRFLLAMNHTLNRALKIIQPKARSFGNPSHIFCTLSSPWFILRTRNLNITRDQEFEITEGKLDEFINEDIAKLKEELKDTLPPEDVRIIEKKIIQMKLNGYEVKNPYKRKTSQMGIFMTVGVSSKKVIESIERKLSSFFHATSVRFGVFPVAAFNAVRDIFPTQRSFIFLDVTGEATDVSLVNNDILIGTVSFPRGENFFIRELSTGLRTVHEEAITLFSMFIRGELNASKQAQVGDILSRAEAEWLARFKKSLKTLSMGGALSRSIFYTTDADIAPFFSSLINNATSETFGGVLHGVQYLDQLIVAKFVSFEPGVPRDPFIVIEALLAEKIFGLHNE